MTFIGSCCDNCIHKHKELLEGWLVSCDAFPEGGIPYEIYHRKEYKCICSETVSFEMKKDSDG